MDLMSLQRNWLACVLLFAARTGGIYLGSGVGGKVGGQPKEFYEKYWMSFLTQARMRAPCSLFNADPRQRDA
eukprot:6172875-Pleurochrysis_carterae.AAC.2